jgi:predicted nucleic acid-binding protein
LFRRCAGAAGLSDRLTRLSIDLDALLRRCKSDKWRAQLSPRPIDRLVAAASLAESNRLRLLPDTNVYIRNLAGSLPATVAALIDQSLLWHSSVCLGEITTGIGHYNPAASDWRRVRQHYAAIFAAIPDSRIVMPDDEGWQLAGLIAGTLARTQNFQPHQRKECLNDALIYLSATKLGLPVVTANRVEFDLIQQVAPGGAFVHF